jgi:putative transferase (TIGR04331 family)
MAPLDSLTSGVLLDDDYWNSILYQIIFKISKYNEFHIEHIIDENKNNIEIYKSAVKYFKEDSLNKNLLIKSYNFLANIIRKDSDALIINSYLSRKMEVLLHLALGQMPQIWPVNDLPLQHGYSLNLRSEIKFKTSYFAESLLNNAFEKLLFRLMPITYLEGYKSLKIYVDTLNWPRRPKFIFTSNNYDCDDIFKIYTAIKTESLGVPYYIGVHGNGYFKYYDNPANFELVADKCLTWGFNHGLIQQVPAMIFTTVGKKMAYDKFGGLLLIQISRYGRERTWDVFEEMQIYFNKQTQFVSGLDPDPKKELTIRLHPYSKNLKWFECEKWKEIFAEIIIDSGKTKLRSLISKSRLVVHGYDSTGLSETLSLNIPTLAILQIGVDQLNDLSKVYYQALIDVGIVHTSAESAAKKVNEIWNDVEGWWNLSTVQDARLLFCSQYGRKSKKPIKELKKILLDGAV